MVDSSPELVDRARSGDKKAFEDLLRPLLASVARLALGLVQEREEAEDVVQEAALNKGVLLQALRFPHLHQTPWHPY